MKKKMIKLTKMTIKCMELTNYIESNKCRISNKYFIIILLNIVSVW